MWVRGMEEVPAGTGRDELVTGLGYATLHLLPE